MIIKVFNQGRCDGSRHMDYLLNEESHAGYQPEVISGDVAITKAVVKSNTKNLKYTAGVISFRKGEDLSDVQQLRLIEDFKAAFAPFDDPARTNFLFVRHRDKDRLELHWVVAKQDLKSGKSWSIFVPGKANLLLYESFTRLQNHKFGFNQVDGKQMTVNDLSFYTKLFTDLQGKRRDYFTTRYNHIKQNNKRRKTHDTTLRPTRPSDGSSHTKNGGIRELTELYRTSFSPQRTGSKPSPTRTNEHHANRNASDERVEQHQNQHQKATHQSGQLAGWGPGFGGQLGRRKQTSSQSSSPSLDTEEEIRKLGIELNYCEPHETAAIIERINQLKGIRQHQQFKPLPKPR